MNIAGSKCDQTREVVIKQRNAVLMHEPALHLSLQCYAPDVYVVHSDLPGECIGMGGHIP
jgi:hypothetical protein